MIFTIILGKKAKIKETNKISKKRIKIKWEKRGSLKKKNNDVICTTQKNMFSLKLRSLWKSSYRITIVRFWLSACAICRKNGLKGWKTKTFDVTWWSVLGLHKNVIFIENKSFLVKDTSLTLFLVCFQVKMHNKSSVIQLD